MREVEHFWKLAKNKAIKSCKKRKRGRNFGLNGSVFQMKKAAFVVFLLPSYILLSKISKREAEGTLNEAKAGVLDA